MSLRLKVCGMRETANIKAVASVHPDYLGFIFYPKSPRFVGDQFLMPDIDPNILKVGVFVNETTAGLLAKAIEYNLPVVQLHGHESPEQCHELRDHNLQVIKAFGVADSIDVALLKTYENHVDFFLFDTKAAPAQYGGTGRRFDWTALKQYNLAVPFFLSGGIRPEHVAEIQTLKLALLYGIDVNSGVETAPGLKDITLIKEIKSTLN